MTDYSRSNILLPILKKPKLLNALDGKDAQFTFQTFDDVKDGRKKSKSLLTAKPLIFAHILQGIFNQHKQALSRAPRQRCRRICHC